MPLLKGVDFRKTDGFMGVALCSLVAFIGVAMCMIVGLSCISKEDSWLPYSMTSTSLTWSTSSSVNFNS